MSEQIKNIKLKFSCTADWDSMPVVDGVKSCEHCSKKVYDFTGSKQDEFLRILAENNNSICGRFSAEQMAVTHPVLPAWKKWVSAALVLVGINLFNNKAEAQQTNRKTETVKFPSPAVAMGDVEIITYDSVAHYKAGEAAFKLFVNTNLRYSNDMQMGKEIIEFNVNKDGSLSNFKIVRSLGPENDAEAIRVLKLSPKWSPAIFKGNPVTSTYTLPIDFQK